MKGDKGGFRGYEGVLKWPNENTEKKHNFINGDVSSFELVWAKTTRERKRKRG